MRVLGAAFVAAAAVATLGCDDTLPPLPEVVVSADTDLAVPLAASRLRVDLYDERGRWFESSDFARPDPRDWPVSFGVYAGDDGRAHRVWVRLRAYVDGRVRDYRGESPFVLGGEIDEPVAASDAPRLVDGGDDATPENEPDPLDAIDRLLLVELEPGQKTRLDVVLHGACLGTSAVFGDDPAVLREGKASTCKATSRERERVRVSKGAADASAEPSRAGTFADDRKCPKRDSTSPVVCVPGGSTVIGATDPTSNAVLEARPIRVLGLHRFWLDRNEYTVARYRDAVARGFVPELGPYANDGPLAPTKTGFCTYSSAPMEREDYSLNCVTWATARALCRFDGGDLPTELQWEHAATVAGRQAKTHYPWGNDVPDCDRAAWGRGTGPLGGCEQKGNVTPGPEDSANDVTPLGIVAMGGGLSEWTLDEARPYTDACWGDAPIVDASCGDPDANAPQRIVRGSSFDSAIVYSTARFGASAKGGFGPVGFRCAYAEAP